MSETERTLEAEIDEMLEDVPAPDLVELDEVQEEVEDVPAEEPEDVVEEPEVEEEVTEEELATVEEDVLEEGEVKDEDEEELEEDSGEEGEESNDLDEFRQRVNKIAEAALRQGVNLPDDLLGIEEEEVETPAPVAAAPVEPQPQPTPMQQQSAQNYDDFQVLAEGINFDDFMDNEQTFVGGMRDVLSRHREMVTQEVMANIPLIIQSQVNQSMALQRATDGFYNNNEDLAAVKPTVGAVANQIVSRHPDWALDKVMEESAKATRKLLRMPSPTVQKHKRAKGKVNPSFAKAGKSQRNKVKPKTSKLQQQIDELL